MLALLGLSPDATPDAIKQRYRELARKFHPDFNQTDMRAQTRFRAITSAYERLLDDREAEQPSPLSAESIRTPLSPSRVDTARAIPVDITLAQVMVGVQLGVALADGRIALVDVPAGAESGTLLRPAGFDVLVEVRVLPDPTYSRRGTDLHVRVSITADVAWEGTRLDLTTPSGPARVLVPPRSRHGDVVRVIARGVPGPRGRGDLFVELGT